MYLCVECRLRVNTVDLLLSHYKIEHNYSTISTYTCAQGSCNRIFGDKKSFKKHLNSSNHDSYERDSCDDVIDRAKLNITVYENVFSPNANLTAKSSASTVSVDNEVECQNHSVDQFSETVTGAADAAMHRLYNNDSPIALKTINTMIQTFEAFLGSGVLEMLKEKIMYCVRENKGFDEVFEMLSILHDPFENIRSTYLQKQHFQNSGSYVAPERVIIGNELDVVRQKDQKSYDNVPVTVEYIPIKSILKKYLEHSDHFEVILQYLETLAKDESETMRNFCQGTTYKEILKRFPGKLVIALLLYYDDYGVTNPLAPNASSKKIGSVYFNIAGLPVEYLAELEHILVTQIMYTRCRSNFGNEAVFKHLIKDLKDLETEGLVIQSKGQDYTVHFALGTVLGDNLGVNSLLGFVESFSAKHPCRVCTADLEMMRMMVEQDDTLLRNVQNYDDGLKNLSITECGIKENCIFNELKSFHAVENISCDPMHDIFCGTLRYDVALFIKRIMDDTKISLNAINARIQSFDYGIEERDKPAVITESHIDSGYVIMHAAQMSVLVKYLPLILGDLKDIDKDLWDWFLTFLDFLDIITAKSIEKGMIPTVKDLVKQFLTKRLKLFPKEHLIPKHHMITHTPLQLERNGPVSRLSCMRHEAKHQTLIAYGRICRNHRNIPFTLATRNQLKFAGLLLSKNYCTRQKLIPPNKQMTFSSLEHYNQFRNTFTISAATIVSVMPWIVWNKRLYKKKLFVRHLSEDGVLPKFASIEHIFSTFNRTFSVLKEWETIGFNEHVHAYCIVPKDKFFGLDFNDLSRYGPIHKKTFSGDGFEYLVYYE